MRWLTSPCLTAAAAALLCGCAAQSAKISKVLPHYLDQKGQHTPAPSLFERDAHQARLRDHAEEVSGLRFDIHWRSTVYYVSGLSLKLELRGSRSPEVVTLEQTVEKRPWYQRWTAFELDRATFDQLGEVVAWRASLWDGERLLAEQQSFLW